MMAEQPISDHERIINLEQQVELLKRGLFIKQTSQTILDAGLLVRLDGFIPDIRRVETNQARGLDATMTILNEHGVSLEELKAEVAEMRSHLEKLPEILSDHKAAIERISALAPGIEQILAFINGQRRHD